MPNGHTSRCERCECYEPRQRKFNPDLSKSFLEVGSIWTILDLLSNFENFEHELYWKYTTVPFVGHRPAPCRLGYEPRA